MKRWIEADVAQKGMPARRRDGMGPLKGSPWVLSVGGSLTVGMLGLASAMLLARSLGPSGRGEFTEATLWPGLILTVGGVANTQSVVYFWARARGPKAKSAVFGTALLGCLILAVALVPLALLVNAVALGWQGKASFAAANVYALSIPISMLGLTIGGVFLAEEKLASFWGMRAANGLLYVCGLAALLLVRTVTVTRCILAVVVALALSTTGSVALGASVLPRRLAWDVDLAREIAGFGLKSNLAGLPYQLNVRLDQLLMSILLPPYSLGIYVVAVGWAGALSFLGGGVSSLMLSRSAAVDAADGQGLAVLAGQFRAAAIVVFGTGMALAAATPVAIPVLFGRPFLASVLPGVVLCGAGVFLNLNVILHELIRGLGHPGVGARAESVGLGVTVVLLAVLLPLWGPVGAATASLGSYVSVFFALVVLTRRRVGLSFRSLLVPTLSDLVFLRSGVAGLSPTRSAGLDGR